MSFDPIQYKQTTRAQWEAAAPAWHRWGPFLETWLGDATEQMLDAAGLAPGHQVLDVAAGAGGQSLAASRRVGEGGRVLATDISPAILSFAAKAAAEAGVTNIETRELDGEALDGLDEAAYDAVLSRLGLIYFPDQQGALAGMHRAVREGGRVAAIVYSSADRNGFFSLAVNIIRERAQLPAPAPGQPGPFSLGGPGVLEASLKAAGFRDVAVHPVDAPLRMLTASECVRFERESFGALQQMLAPVPAADRPAVWEEITTTLSRFETDDGFVGPCELLVGVGTR